MNYWTDPRDTEWKDMNWMEKGYVILVGSVVWGIILFGILSGWLFFLRY